MTRSDLIEIIARAIGEHNAPDHVPDLWRQEASAILAALSSAGLAVVPKDAGDSLPNERKMLQPSTLYKAAVEYLDLAQDRAMVAAEDLAVCKESLHTEGGETGEPG